MMMKAYSPDPYANDETERWNGLLCPMSNHDPSTLYYYLTDHVGTVLRIVKEDGTVVNQYDYDAFGRVRIYSSSTLEGIENRYLFQGRGGLGVVVLHSTFEFGGLGVVPKNSTFKIVRGKNSRGVVFGHRTL